MSKEQEKVRRPLGADRSVSAGKRELVTFLDKNVTVNSNLYVKVLNGHMLPFYADHDSTFLAGWCSLKQSKKSERVVK